jgi:hypothetical protein
MIILKVFSSSAMYRSILIIFFLIACDSAVQRNSRPVSDSMVTYLKDSINPLFHNLELTKAKKKLDSILPIVRESNNYIDMCSWLRCMTVAYTLENKYDSARIFADRALKLALEKDTTQRQILGGKIQLAEVLSGQKSFDTALNLGDWRFVR